MEWTQIHFEIVKSAKFLTKMKFVIIQVINFISIYQCKGKIKFQ